MEEQYFLVRLLSGELRQGALDGVMTEAVARASGVPVALVRRAVMLRGSLPAVALAALDGGADALSEFGLLVGQPLKPMLASSAPSVEAALSKIAADAATGRGGGDRCGAAAEAAGRRLLSGGLAGDCGTALRRRWSGSWTASGYKHMFPAAASGCSRARSTTSPRGCPRWWRRWRRCRCGTAVFDGELIALRPDGRPYAFQDTAARAASEIDPRRRPRCRCRSFSSTCCTWTGPT